MKKMKLAVIIFAIIILSLAALSQISDSSTISVNEGQDCIVTYYNQTIDVFGNVTRYRDIYGTCFNSTNQSNYPCVTGNESYQNYEDIGDQVILKNTTKCRTGSFTVSVNKSGMIEKKEIDFSGYGICVQGSESNCATITCGTLEGGSARNGIFNGCDGGKSCQKFLFCADKTEVLYKGSGSNFMKEDPTFHASKLAYKEVE